MSFVKCYDVAEMVIDEATRQFGYVFEVDKRKKQELKECCDKIDVLAENFGGVSYEVEVDDKTADIMVSLICDELEAYTSSDEFYVLMRKAKKAGFKAYKDDKLQLYLIFSGIWNKIF